MQCSQNAQASLATTVSYMCKMFMKFIPGRFVAVETGLLRGKDLNDFASKDHLGPNETNYFEIATPFPGKAENQFEKKTFICIELI